MALDSAHNLPMRENEQHPLPGFDQPLNEAVLGAARARYEKFIVKVDWSDCWWWTGAISGRGHGRFWVEANKVVIAHRFAWGLHHGAKALADAPMLRHSCDNPLCQNVDHLSRSTVWENTREWATRRHRSGWPLQDTRGAHGRALAIRNALKGGGDARAIALAGLQEDENQLTLF